MEESSQYSTVNGMRGTPIKGKDDFTEEESQHEDNMKHNVALQRSLFDSSTKSLASCSDLRPKSREVEVQTTNDQVLTPTNVID